MTYPTAKVRLVFALIAATGACSCERDAGRPSVPPTPPSAPTSKDDAMTIRPDRPARWSLAADPERLAALKSGRERLGLTVDAYDPPDADSPAIVVRAVVGGKKREIDRFEITPNVPFRVAEGASPQRFFIDLLQHPALLDNPKIEVEATFDAGAGKPRKGLAHVSFEIVKVP